MDTTRLEKEFQRIKAMGFIPNVKQDSNDGGAGNTFEKWLGVRENNLKEPDFEGFEVKTISPTSDFIKNSWGNVSSAKIWLTHIEKNHKMSPTITKARKSFITFSPKTTFYLVFIKTMLQSSI
jgi:hypothetical protein